MKQASPGIWRRACAGVAPFLTGRSLEAWTSYGPAHGISLLECPPSPVSAYLGKAGLFALLPYASA